jgi:hypothetical protein
MLKRWDELFRYTITFIGIALFIGSVFFAFTGDWSYITSFSYWIDTFFSTTFAWSLRPLWQPKGEEIALASDSEISELEVAKSKLIEEVSKRKLSDVLKRQCEEDDKREKVQEWHTYCAKKVQQIKQSKLLPFKSYFLNKWQNKFDEVVEYLEYKDNEQYKGTFNVENVSIEYFEYDYAKIMSSNYRLSEIKKKGRYNRQRSLKRSYRINIVTFFLMAIFGGIQVLINSFMAEDVVILGGKLIMFALNIRSGIKIGVSGISVEYHEDLSKDLNYLKTFIKNNNGDVL